MDFQERTGTNKFINQSISLNEITNMINNDNNMKNVTEIFTVTVREDC